MGRFIDSISGNNGEELPQEVVEVQPQPEPQPEVKVEVQQPKLQVQNTPSRTSLSRRILDDIKKNSRNY